MLRRNVSRSTGCQPVQNQSFTGRPPVLRNAMQIVVSLALSVCLAATARAAEKPIILGYFAEWEHQYTVADIPAEKLTHVNYAFAVLREGKCALKDEKTALRNFAALHALKENHPHLKTLISVGGWADSNGFSEVALTDESRKVFAESCADFINMHGFDGVDIDWEFPVHGGMQGNSKRPEDKQNFTALLAQLRKTIDARSKQNGRSYLLTIAASAGANREHTELDRIHRSLDFINLMTYDFAGFWSATTAFNSALHRVPDHPDHPEQLSIEASVQAYLDAGVPREKIVVGVPFYGRGWAGVGDANNGLFQPHDGKPVRGTHESGYWSWRGIKANELGSMKRHWHAQAAVPWLYDTKRRLMISYDDPQSLKRKAEFVRDQQLGGVMFWELSGDDEEASLLNALHEGLRQ